MHESTPNLPEGTGEQQQKWVQFRSQWEKEEDKRENELIDKLCPFEYIWIINPQQIPGLTHMRIARTRSSFKYSIDDLKLHYQVALKLERAIVQVENQNSNQ